MYQLVSILGGVRATVFASVAVLALALCGVQSYRLDMAKKKVTDIELAQSKANEAHQRELRAKEAAMAKALQDAANKSLQEQKDAKATADKLLADVAAGGMRERFSCPRVPPSPGAPPRVDGEERRGLLEEDARFLISEAHRADQVTIERNELVEIVKELRKILNERR